MVRALFRMAMRDRRAEITVYDRYTGVYDTCVVSVNADLGKPTLKGKLTKKGIKLTYCTDTRPTDAIRQHAKGSDLFICEGMYGEKEKAAKAVEYKHMTFYEAAEIARDAEVKEMWLTHYSPSLTRPEEYMDDVRTIFPRAIAGKDRMTTELDFPE